MDSVKQSKSSWITKALHVQAVNSHEKMKKDQAKQSGNLSFGEEDKKTKDKAIEEALLAKIFASISTIKAAYAQMQLSQSPYNADGIQPSDQTIVSEMKNLSELKQCYPKKQLHEFSPEQALASAEIQEHKSLLKTYEIMAKNLDSQLRLKESEITFLNEKLSEISRDNEKNLNFSIQFSDLKTSHFVTYYHQAVKSIRSFVRLLISVMESANWNLDIAASSIEPGISFWKPNHKFFAFESFVCKRMFDGFNSPNFSTKAKSKKDRKKFFSLFMEMKSASTADYLARKPESVFASLCREKYMKLVHQKMELLVIEKGFPEITLFSVFCEMWKYVWLLHCLGMSFEHDVSVFEVGKGELFSEVYMESLNEEAFLPETCPKVAFTVVPGFRVGRTIVQSQVYLC